MNDLLVSTSKATRCVASVQACALLCSRACVRGGVGASVRNTLIARAKYCDGCQLCDSILCQFDCCLVCRSQFSNIYSQ